MDRDLRLLILSNQCISNVTSNGRTMRNFLQGWPKCNLAQFCIKGTAPDFSVCDRYYCVSDGAALRAFLSGKPAIASDLQEEVQSQARKQAAAGTRRNALTMLLREWIWNSMRWAGADFYRWVEQFRPEQILLQSGDCGFMLRLARHLAQRYQIPLVIYNSEGYYFKDFDYFRSRGVAKLAYPGFRRYYCREFEKTMDLTAGTVYCCDKLKRDYDVRFSGMSTVIHTATQMQSKPRETWNSPLRISYLGNLGVGRHESLIQIGEALQQISPEGKLDVYGPAEGESVMTALEHCPGIRYRGFVDYETVVQVIRDSDILVHGESFDAFYREDLKYAFSTKIADSLGSGRCFVLYAPEEMACTAYLQENGAAHVVTRQEALLPTLRKLWEDPWERGRYVNRAQTLAKENHDMENNSARFQQFLRESGIV